MTTNILLVDDNPDVIETVKAVFGEREPDINVVGVESGKEALEILNKEMFHLVLLDIMMSPMSGWDVAAKMKEDPKLKDISIIFLTAKTDELSRQMGGLSGEDYVHKPFKTDDLIKRVKDILLKDEYVKNKLMMLKV